MVAVLQLPVLPTFGLRMKNICLYLQYERVVRTWDVDETYPSYKCVPQVCISDSTWDIYIGRYIEDIRKEVIVGCSLYLHQVKKKVKLQDVEILNREQTTFDVWFASWFAITFATLWEQLSISFDYVVIHWCLRWWWMVLILIEQCHEPTPYPISVPIVFPMRLWGQYWGRYFWHVGSR